MSAASYAVVCELGFQNYDRRRAGYAAARGAFAELRRLVGLDDRVRNARMERSGRTAVEVSFIVDASTRWEAFDLARAVLRTAIHANGGSTVGWEGLRPQVEPVVVGGRTARRRRRARDRRHLPPVRPVEPRPDWAKVSETARRRVTALPELPPLSAPLPELASIDLR